MADLAHLSGSMARPGDLAGGVLEERPGDRQVLIAYAAKSDSPADADRVERGAWQFAIAAREAHGPVRALENQVYRGPDWSRKDAAGRAIVVGKGAWLVRFALDAAAWKGYKAGEVRLHDLLTAAQTGAALKRNKQTMGNKKLNKAIKETARNLGAVGTTPVATALQRQVFGGSRPFAVFEARVALAQRDLEKAKLNEDEYATAVAKSELYQARQALTAVKMIAAEHARERDPGTMARIMRGQGVPLVTNRHALGDDPGVQGI